MTEKQGGSDVRANTTVARPLTAAAPAPSTRSPATSGSCSAPMCDVFLVLAQAAGGLSCFLFPRWTPDGERNPFRIQRLKDKLGNRSNASSEVEFDGASAWLVGEEGGGVRTIIEMVNHTRLDCVIGGAPGCGPGSRRPSTTRRTARPSAATLIDQPLMRNVLADLAWSPRRPRSSAIRLAGATDEAIAGDERGAILAARHAVPKYWVCKRAPAHAAECLECLGGNGYVEESGMPRLFRECPLNSIWEGSGNVRASTCCGP